MPDFEIPGEVVRCHDRRMNPGGGRCQGRLGSSRTSSGLASPADPHVRSLSVHPTRLASAPVRMNLRADQLRVGDQLMGGEVVWVLPTPDHEFILVAVQPPWASRRGQPRYVTRQYRPSASVVVLADGHHPPPLLEGASEPESAYSDASDGEPTRGMDDLADSE